MSAEHLAAAPSAGEKSGLRRFAALQFFSGGAQAALGNYIMVYMDSLGMSAMQAGVLLTLMNVMALLGRFTWGYLCDRYQRVRIFFIMACGMSALLAFFFWTARSSVWASVLLYGAFSLFFFPCASMMDAWYFKRMRGREGEFGRVKLWWPAGILLSSALCGLLVDRGGFGYLFVIFFVFIAASALSSFLPPDVLRERGGDKPKLSLKPLTRNRPFLFILIWGVFAVSAYTTITGYLGLTAGRLSDSAFYFGTLTMTSCVSEMCFYRATPRLLRRLGPQLLMVLSLTGFAVQGIVMSLSASPWQLYAAVLSQGMGFALLTVGLKFHISMQVPNELQASAQGLTEAAQNGIGGIFSGLGGGAIMSAMGLPALQGIGSVMCAAAILALISERYIAWRRQNGPSGPAVRP